MPTGKVDRTIDTALDQYQDNLPRVLRNFQNRVIDIVNQSVVNKAGQIYDVSTFASNWQEMAAALNEAGYMQLAQELVETYPEIAQEIKGVIANVGGPDFRYSTIDRQTLQELAAVDLDKFGALGTSGVRELHYQLFNQAVSSAPFSDMVSAIEAAVTGPMANHAKTHANTAILSFSGQAMQKAGEEIGFDDPQSKWRAQGPLDSLTRDICRKALSEKVQTRQEWEDMGYWGGAPGGWNCRHWLIPYFGDGN